MSEHSDAVAVVVTVADDRLDDLDAIRDALTQAGLRVTQVLSGAGIISGTLAADGVQRLRAVPGVQDVETDAPMRALE